MKTPRKLYRYRPMGDYAAREIDALEQGAIYFSRFEQLNDPAEGVDADIEPLPKAFSSMMGLLLNNEEHGRQIAKVTEAQARLSARSYLDKKKCGVCCFSQTATHQALWAYYASSHAGICIEYDIAILMSTDFCWGNKVSSVIYTDERRVKQSDVFKDRSGEISLLAKARDWKHENEWRCFLYDKSGFGFHSIDAVSAITLGSRISEKDKDLVIKVADKLNCEVRQASFSGYQLTFKKVRSVVDIKPVPKTKEGKFFQRSIKTHSKSIPNFRQRLASLVDKVSVTPKVGELWFVSYKKEADRLFLHFSVFLSNGEEAHRKVYD